MPEPVASACARHEARVARLHPFVDAKIAPAADVALRLSNVIRGGLLQHPPRIAVAAATMEAGHVTPPAGQATLAIYQSRCIRACRALQAGWRREAHAPVRRRWRV